VIRACVFDMDGVLIDTEPVWRRVEQEVFARVGVHLTEAQLLETWGKRIDEVVDHWYTSRPWDGVRPHAVAKAIVDDVIAHVRAHGEAAPGAREAIATARAAGLKVAIASSSSRRLIDAVVKRLEVEQHVDAVLSADDEKQGKPAPDVYLRAAWNLGVRPEECVAIEDSPVGVESAKAAHMRCIALITQGVDPADLGEADIVIERLDEFTPALLRRLPSGLNIVGRRRTD
jgi:mannitol-1-/sugar-/sorbitol-6-/2-deoxyglucose-6-phosphatase